MAGYGDCSSPTGALMRDVQKTDRKALWKEEFVLEYPYSCVSYCVTDAYAPTCPVMNIATSIDNMEFEASFA